MYDQWIEAFEIDEVTAIIMLDLSVAFDVVDHVILIQKLEHYGFEDCAITWLRSYLCGRSQRVYVEGALSESLQLEAWVPHGSILGDSLLQNRCRKDVLNFLNYQGIRKRYQLMRFPKFTIFTHKNARK